MQKLAHFALFFFIMFGVCDIAFSQTSNAYKTKQKGSSRTQRTKNRAKVLLYEFEYNTLARELTVFVNGYIPSKPQVGAQKEINCTVYEDRLVYNLIRDGALTQTKLLAIQHLQQLFPKAQLKETPIVNRKMICEEKVSRQFKLELSYFLICYNNPHRIMICLVALDPLPNITYDGTRKPTVFMVRLTQQGRRLIKQLAHIRGLRNAHHIAFDERPAAAIEVEKFPIASWRRVLPQIVSALERYYKLKHGSLHRVETPE